MTNNKPTEAAATDFTGTWRYKIGLFLIIFGNVGILLAVTVLPFLGISAGIIGALALGCEITTWISIVFLGMQGFKAIKAKISGALKVGYTTTVSRTRHRIGIILLLLSTLNVYIIAAYAWIAFGKTTPENPFPEVFGLSFQGQKDFVLWVFLVCQSFFLISIYVLGAEWWGRFRNIFVWKVEAE